MIVISRSIGDGFVPTSPVRPAVIPYVAVMRFNGEVLSSFHKVLLGQVDVSFPSLEGNEKKSMRRRLSFS